MTIVILLPPVCGRLRTTGVTSSRLCFDGVEKNSIIAIGMIGCEQNKKEFLRGYDYMLSKIEPEAVICFGTPFDEMLGNIIPIDYRSSRKVVR